jgi:C1A family cysteine protease
VYKKGVFMHYAYGWKKSNKSLVGVPKYEAPHMATLPKSVDLTQYCPPVYDQGNLGSCTANAAAAMSQFLMIKHGLGDYMPSRLALYWWNRFQEKTVNQDSGASLYDAMNTLVKYGVPHENLWPYITEGNRFIVKPTKDVWSDGYWHSIDKGMSVVQNLTVMKTCLAQGYPFMFGFLVYQSFESEVVARTGIMPMPGYRDAVLGGHAVMAVGYDDSMGMFKIRNSWGNTWGLNGYFYMPYNYIISQNLADDFWTARNYLRYKTK